MTSWFASGMRASNSCNHYVCGPSECFNRIPVCARETLCYCAGMTKLLLSHLAETGALISLRVTPNASRNAIDQTQEGLRIYVTAPPENGKANIAVTKLLSKALGVPKSKLELVKGATRRDKVFRIIG